MPKVRILSGAQVGAVLEMSLPEAEVAVAYGFAEVIPDVKLPKPRLIVKTKSEEPPKKPKR